MRLVCWYLVTLFVLSYLVRGLRLKSNFFNSDDRNQPDCDLGADRAPREAQAGTLERKALSVGKDKAK